MSDFEETVVNEGVMVASESKDVCEQRDIEEHVAVEYQCSRRIISMSRDT